MTKHFFGPMKFETQFTAKAVYWVFIVSILALTACGPKHESRKKKTPSTEAVPDTSLHPELPIAGTPLFSAPDGHMSQNAHWQVRLEWKQGPTANNDGESLAYITFADATFFAPNSISDIRLKPWMRIHGHGTGNLVPTIIPVIDNPTKFLVSEIYFLMSGPWELQINATINGNPDYIEVNVEVDP